MPADDAPAHLAPVVAAACELQAPPGSPCPQILFAQCVTRAILDHLRATPGGADVTRRGLAYVQAVDGYVRATAGRYPIDIPQVAANHYLLPVSRGRDERAHSRAPPPGTPVLVDPAGVLYADPLTLVSSAAHPDTVERLLLTDGHTMTPSEASGDPALAAAFQWPPDTFPFAGAVLAGGGLIVRGPGAGGQPSWVRLSPGAAPEDPKVVPSPVSHSDAAPRQQRAEEASALKGARGETRVSQTLAERGHSVRDVSHRARSADMVVETAAGPVFVESKDYVAAVPDKEVQKFRRDLGARGAVAGVLVSLSSGIVGVRGALAVRTEVLPGEGRPAPLVYVASGHPDVIAAGVDVAAHLARALPPTLDAKSIHGGDALAAYAAELSELADLYEDARAELGGLSSAAAAGFASVFEKFGAALRDHRRLARAQKAAAEGPVEVAAEGPALWGEFAGRYEVPPQAKSLVAEILERLASTALGDIREASRWRFLKARATHVDTGVALAFHKTRTDFCTPLARVSGRRVAELLARHPKKVRVADEVLALELEDDTAPDALSLV